MSLSKMRKESGMTLKQVSSKTGIAVQQLSAYERGLYVPSVEKFELIANACGYELKTVKRKGG